MNNSRRLTARLARGPAPPPERQAFTLIEVLVVVAILALLVAILLPSLQKARAQSRRTVCLSNLHQLSIGLYTYQADYRGKAPRFEQTLEAPVTNAEALWVPSPVPSGKGHATRLGMLYPRYTGREPDIFFCPDAGENLLINKGDRNRSLYPWSNWGTNAGWVYGSYSYRPRYYDAGGGQIKWAGIDYAKDLPSTAVISDAFAGWWEIFGPYPAHTPVENGPRMLYYNVGYIDGSARPVKDFVQKGSAAPFAEEFRTRAPGPVQSDPYEAGPDSRVPGSRKVSLAARYTPLNAVNDPPLARPKTPEERIQYDKILNTTDTIERGWIFFSNQ